ncbi:MAG TPA: hypothetical protein DD437_05635 [Rhodobiaceae bacterium]|nr:hypothetical protein [Rhodobiaceae bacterium]|tara:strand:+ start:1742 stop:2338 length:597 start_codon:yes stop_codon:yes gene_type:complete
MRGGLLLLGVIVALVGACTPQQDYVRASDARSALTGLSPGSLGSDLAVSQLVTGELLGEGNSVRFELVVDSDQLVLVALTPTGVPLFSVKQTGRDIAVEYMSQKASSLSPEFLIADVKFAYWPIETLNLAIGPFRSRVSEDQVNGVRHRELRDELGQMIVEATYPHADVPTGELVLRRYDIPYRLRVRSLSSPAGAAL